MEICKECKTNRITKDYKLVQIQENKTTYWCQECLRKYTNKYAISMSIVYKPKTLRVLQKTEKVS